MHHYTTVLSALGVREKVAHLWRYYIPQQALNHKFLLHGLLAFAALHLAYLNPDSSNKYIRLCDKHQGVAVERFRSILSSPFDPELADALFALSAILSISSMGRSCALSETTSMDMDDVSELFNLTKGIANMIQLARERIEQGPLAEMLEKSTYPPGIKVNLPIRVESRFEALRYMLGTYGLDQEALEHCQNALTELEDIYKIIVYFSSRTDIEINVVSQWQVRVSMGYVRLIQDRSPPALVILAYYAASVTAIRSAWYTQNWAELTLRGITELLEENMQQWLQWPMQQLQDTMSELGVQSPPIESSWKLAIHSKDSD